ncbi:MAG: DNA helicase UvrD [Nitrospirae bacterium]|nr:DNA helicase UvrD [Nitrospirota bacterium]
MRFIADLHIHSKYSRATSKEMSPESIWKWAQLKGIRVIGTGDFTHPQWLKELQEKLEPAGNGLFILTDKLRINDVPDSCKSDVSFMLSAEISCIYKKNDKTRKVHSLLFVPDFADAARISIALSKIGNINSDGRPILGLDAKELLKIVMDAAPDVMYVPAHAWTPHFSVFGAVSGFDSLEECFDELTPHIHAIETGLSSDPAMNRRLSALDNITLISNSDAHSPAKIGREANIFDTEISYRSMIDALKTQKGFEGTIEFFPEEGKYHYDGHRACGVSLTPKETISHNYLCPVCRRKVTVGVMHRVDKLADREDGFKPEGAPGFHSIIPLPEIISETLKVGVNSKAVSNAYLNLLAKLGNEFNILMNVPLDDIEKASSPLFREAVSRMRKGEIHIAPGYDGEFGKIRIFEEAERKESKGRAIISAQEL